MNTVPAAPYRRTPEASIDLAALPLPREPYRGILPFRLLDWRIFVEREADTERLVNLVSMYRGVLLYGQSGAGKSSLLNAGLLPHALRRGRSPERIRVLPQRDHELVVERIRLHEEGDARSGDRPKFLPSRFSDTDNDERISISCGAFLERLGPRRGFGMPLLIFDQFEELVTLFEQNPRGAQDRECMEHARLRIEKLLCHLLLEEQPAVKVIFAFRDDYLARLTPLFARIPNLLDQRVLLLSPPVETIPGMVRGPFVPAADGERGLPGHFKPELDDKIAQKIAEGARQRPAARLINLSELQTLCLALWRQPKLRRELLNSTEPALVLQRILESEALAALHALPLWDRIRAMGYLSKLVTRDGTRDVVSEASLIAATGRLPALWLFRGPGFKKLLRKLPAMPGLVRRTFSAGTTYYELSSEFLIPWIQRRQKQLRTIATIYAFLAGLLVLLVAGYATLWALDQKQVAEAATAIADRRARVTSSAVVEIREAHAEAQRRRKEAEASAAQASRERDEAKKAKEEADNAHREAETARAAAEAAARETSAALAREKQAAQEAEEHKRAAEQATKSAVVAKQAAEKFIDYLQRDLRDKLLTAGRVDLAQEVTLIVRRYWNDNPPPAEDVRALQQLAAAIGQEGEDHYARGNFAGALKSFQDSLTIFEGMVARFPESRHWRKAVYVGKAKLADAVLAQGDLPKALATYRESVEQREALAKAEPDNEAFLRDLSVGYDRIAEVLQQQGRLGEALLYFQRGFDASEDLARREPANVERQRDLAVGYYNLGAVRHQQGLLGQALELHRAGLDIAKTLAGRFPGNGQWQNDIAASHKCIGDIRRDQGEADAALDSYRQALAIAERIVAEVPTNAEWLHDLSKLHVSLGEARRLRGEFAEALASYRNAVAVAERLQGVDPTNTDCQAVIAAAQTGMGHVFLQQGQLDASLQAHQQSLRLRRTQAERDPQNLQQQFTTAQAGSGVGRVLLAQQRAAEARPYFETLRAAAGQVIAAEPTYYAAHVERAAALALLAETVAGTEAPVREQRREFLAQAIAALEAERRHAPLQPQHEKELAIYRERLGALAEPAANPP